MMHVPASLPGSPQARLLPQPLSLQKDTPPPCGPCTLRSGCPSPDPISWVHHTHSPPSAYLLSTRTRMLK